MASGLGVALRGRRPREIGFVSALPNPPKPQTKNFKSKTFNAESTEKRGELRLVLPATNGGSVFSEDFLCVLRVKGFFRSAGYFRYVRTISMRSSAASSEDLVFRGMWLRMWSSINSPMRLLMAPRAAERRCSTSAQGSSWSRARPTASSCPTIFLVRVSKSSFSLDKCDILLDYPMGVWYQCPGPLFNGPKGI